VYAAQAVATGAAAIVGDRRGLTTLEGVPYLFAESPRKALGVIAHALVGDPSKSMTVIGVTGTNGKSSTVLMTQRVLETCGLGAGVIGTIGYDVGGGHIPAPHTTPFGEDLADLFRRAREAGKTHMVMEVSSHSLDQDRVAGIEFDVAEFTNLTQDHLDYHLNMDEYRRAKLKLFESIEGPGRFTVVNTDDPSARYFIEASKTPCHTYGREGECRAENVRIRPSGMHFDVKSPWGAHGIEMTLLGHHNVSNALGVISICCGLGLPLEDVAKGIASLPCVRGRFERVDAGQDFHVVVDYAHTDDGLLNVLRAAREICDGRVLVVFGCGGDRDKTKRPKMARAAATLSDFALVTSDNPRSEDPLAIIADIEAGMKDCGKQRDEDYLVIPDRAEAIRRAIKMARLGDLVMIAGKGHEDYQILGDKRIHFDDVEEAKKALEGR
jgi:UDP-N-acetylmuramoyl-L-alanyl-D-glutamate--2,6-diaminopimelate ligase